MEYHPIKQPSTNSPTPSSSSSSPSSPTDDGKPPCPDSVLKGDHGCKLPPKSSSLSTFNPSLSSFHLTQQQIDDFYRTGCLIIKARDIWSEDELKLLKESVNVMDNWPDMPGGYMKYYEKNQKTGEKQMCRIENFCQYNPGMNYFCNGNKLIAACSELFGCESILYKEKINYKLPGGAGFVCHQDVSAGWWMYGQSLHLSVLVCIDRATTENGCLEVALKQHDRGMLCEPWKEITKEVEDSMEFVSLETEIGDVIFFDSYVPHRSAANHTDQPRRVLYATYAKKEEGDFRERYYKDKRESYPPDCERLPGKNYEYKV